MLRRALPKTRYEASTRVCQWLAVVVLVLSAASSAQAGWLFEEMISSSGNNFYLSARSVATDWRGWVHVVYSYGGELYHAYWDGTAWNGPHYLDYQWYSPQIACDPQGNVHLVYHYGGSSSLQYRRFDGFSWSDATVLEALGNPDHAALTVDASGNVHVVWRGSRDGNDEIYYRRWDGVVWGPVERLTYDGNGSYNTTVAVYQSGRSGDLHAVHVAWVDTRDGQGQGIYYKHWDGTSWSADSLVSEPDHSASQPNLAVDSNGRVHLAWIEYRDDNHEVFHRDWDDGGGTPPTRLTFAAGDAGQPSLAQGPGGQIHLVWQDSREYVPGIWYRGWEAGQWSPELALPTGEGDSHNPCIDADLNGDLFVAYRGYRVQTGTWSVFLMRNLDLPVPELQAVEPNEGPRDDIVALRLLGSGFVAPASAWLEMAGEAQIQAQITRVESTEVRCTIDLTGAALGAWDVVFQNPDGTTAILAGGFTVLPAIVWTQDERLTFDAGSSAYPALAADGDNRVHLVWNDARPAGANPSVYYRFLEGGLWSPEQRLVDHGYGTESPDVAADSLGRVYVVWCDSRGGSPQLYFKYWNLSVWSDDELLTTDPYGTGVYNPAIAVDAMGRVHLAWSETRSYNSDSEIYYRRWEGGTWLPEERLTMAPSDSYAPTIAVDATGSIHLVYLDYRSGGRDIYHRQWTDGSWGAETLVEDGCRNCTPSLAVGPTGMLHLLYLEYDHMAYRSYDGVSWTSPVYVPFGYYYSEGHDFAIASDPQGVLHVVASNDDWGRIRYTKGDGVSWTPVQDIVSRYTPGLDFMVDGAGNLHLAWMDGRDGNYEIYYKRRGQAALPPVLQAFEPGTLPAFGTQEITAVGILFVPPCQLELRGPGGTVLTGQVIEQNSTMVRARFDLTGAPTGSYDAVLYNASGQEGFLADALVLTESPWGLETRLTFSGGVSSLASNAGRALVWDTLGNAHLVWQDERDGVYEVYYRCATGGGWTPEERISVDDISASLHPVVADGGSDRTVVAWCDARDGNPEIYARVRTGGVWAAQETRLTSNPYPSQFPVLAGDGAGRVQLVWQDGRDGNWEIYTKAWINGVWETTSTRLTADPGASTHPSVTADGLGQFYVSWQDDRSGSWQIYSRRWTGGIWEPEGLVSEESGGAQYPSISSNGAGMVYVVWKDSSDGELYLRRLDVSATAQRVTEEGSWPMNPMLAIDTADALHLVWSDSRTGIEQIWYKVFDGTDWSLSHRMTGSATEATLPCLAAGPEGALALAWRDLRDSDYEIYTLGSLPAAPSSAHAGDAPYGNGPRAECSPNPFTNGLTFRFELPQAGDVALEIFDQTGRTVQSLREPRLSRGRHEIFWDGRDARGQELGTGVYFYRLRAGSELKNGRLLRVR